MPESGLVSVVVPTIDRDDYLAEAVDSVLDQTYGPLELLVVDGAASDATREVVAEGATDAGVEWRYLPQTETAGAAAARNLGLSAADGEFVAFLDDDDRWRPEKLARQVAVFHEGGPDVGVVYTGTTYAGSDETGRDDFCPAIEGDVTRELLFGNFVGSFSRVAVRAAAVEAAGPIDESYATWEDWAWFVRLSRCCEFRAVPDPLVVRRGGHGDQLSHDIDLTYRDSYPRFLREFRPLAAAFGPAFERRFVGAVNYRLGWAALWRGEHDVARRTLFRAVRARPTEVRYLVVLLLALTGRPGKRLYGRLPDALTGRAGSLLRRWT